MVLDSKDFDRIRNSVLFSGLTEQDLGAALDGCETVRFTNSQRLFTAGSEANAVYLILDGVVQLFRGTDDGKHAVLGIRQKGDAVGVSAALSHNIHYSNAQPVNKCRTLVVPNATFRSLLATDGTLAERLIAYLAGNLQDISEHMERLQLLQTTERLANYLWNMAADRPGSVEIMLPCEKGLIATYLGMERESFSRALNKLRSVGVISKGRRIRIQDPSALKDYRVSAA